MKDRIYFKGMKAAHNVNGFGLELNEDRVDCQVGIFVQTDDGLFVITERRWDELTKILHLTMQRDAWNRKGRRQKKIRERVLKARK